MISAPSSSSASLRNAFTVACVPTGMKNGVCTVPWGVVSTPRRAPVGSVFVTSNEKLTLRVYQEKMNAHPTRITTNAAHTPNPMMYGFAPLSFLGVVAAKPMASRIKIQNVNTANDLQSATKQFAESSGRTAAMFVARRFSRSIVLGSFKYKTSRNIGLLMTLVMNAWEVIAKAVEKFVFAPPSSAYAPHMTSPMITTTRIGPQTPMAYVKYGVNFAPASICWSFCAWLS